MNTEKGNDGATSVSRPTSCEGGQRDFGMGWWGHQREHFPGFELIPHLVRLLSEGDPLSVDRLAAASGWSPQAVDAALEKHPGIDRDDRGRIVGFGLTLRPTVNRFIFDGRTVYGFCASDTLFFPVVLGRSGVVESVCATTGQPVRAEVTPRQVARVQPSSAVVSLVRPSEIGDVRAEVCALGQFFASKEAAGAWLAAHPEGMVHSVADDFELHREVMEKLGWAPSGS